MNPLKLIKRLVKLLRGGAGSWEVFVGCLLGMVIGLTPGFNMTIIIAVLLVLVLNVNMALVLTAAVIGKALCLTLAPVTFKIGYFLIHGIGLEGLFRAISMTPVLALMNLHYYCLLGGLLGAIVLGCAMGWVIARLVHLARLAIIAGGERSERFRKLSGNILVRIILRLVFGKQKRPMAETLQAKRPLFRKAGMILCVIVIAGVLVFEHSYADKLAAAGLKAGLEVAAGAEVNLGEVDFSLLSGRIRVKDLQVTDREKPTHNSVQIEILEGDVAVIDLLARRLVLEKIHVGRIDRDVKRATPGKVFERPERPEPKLPEVTISDYFDRAQKVLKYLRKVKDYLDERSENRRKAKKHPTEEELKELARLRGYLRLSADDVLARWPAVTIRRLEIDEVRIGDAGRYSLVGEQLSEAPELNSAPMKLTVTDKKGFHGAVTLDFTDQQPRHSFALRLPDVPVGDLIRLSKRVPLDISHARADIATAGEFTADTVNLPMVIQLREMKASPVGGRGFLGLDSATAAKVFEHVSTMKIVGGLKGPLAGPQPWIDEKALMNDLEKTLAEAGKNALADMVGKQAEKLIGKVPIPTDTGALGDVLKGMDDLLPDKDKEETTTKPAGILDRLPKGLGP